MNSTEDKIEFYQHRDFGGTINIAFKFLGKNFRKFLKTILFIVGPPLLLFSISYALLYSNLLAGAFSGKPEDMFSNDSIMFMIIEYIVIIITGLLTGIFFSGAVIHYLLLYRDRGNDFDVDDVWKALMQDFWRLAGTAFGIGLLIFCVFLVIAIVIGIFMAIIPVLGVVFMVLLVFSMLIVMPPMIYQINSVYILRLDDRNEFLESIKRSFDIIKGSYWWTWLICFVSLLMTSTLSYIFFIPLYFVYFSIMLHTIDGNPVDDPSSSLGIAFSVAMFFSTILHALPLLIVSFHHFSLIEKKEGRGLLKKIDDIGTNQEGDVETSY